MGVSGNTLVMVVEPMGCEVWWLCGVLLERYGEWRSVMGVECALLVWQLVL